MKLTEPLERVLRVFLAEPDARYYGYDLMKVTKLKSGTLYPMLARLESEGLATSAWEWPNEDGRPPRKYYRLTAEGKRQLREQTSGWQRLAAAVSQAVATTQAPSWAR